MPWIYNLANYDQKYTNMIIYVGFDQSDNTLILRDFALPFDVWYHVNAQSSAHVYLRIPGLKNLNDIPQDLQHIALLIVRSHHKLSITDTKTVSVIYTFA
jgi:hypothetical protein